MANETGFEDWVRRPQNLGERAARTGERRISTVGNAPIAELELGERAAYAFDSGFAARLAWVATPWHVVASDAGLLGINS